MTSEQAKYKELIQSSPLFDIDKEAQSNRYKVESLKMTEYVYRYITCGKLRALENPDENDVVNYGLEITETVRDCIKYYDKEKGEFFNYVMSSWSKKRKEAWSKEHLQNHSGGMAIGENLRDRAKQLFKYMNLHNADYHAHREELKQHLQLNDTQLRELDMLVVLQVESVEYEHDTDDGETYKTELSDEKTSESLHHAEAYESVLDAVETAFCRLQSRQRPILSELITASLAEEVEARYGGRYEALTGKYSFLNKEILDRYRSSRVLPTNKEIAEKYSRSESSVSRTLTRFREEICKLI